MISESRFCDSSLCLLVITDDCGRLYVALLEVCVLRPSLLKGIRYMISPVIVSMIVDVNHWKLLSNMLVEQDEVAFAMMQKRSHEVLPTGDCRLQYCSLPSGQIALYISHLQKVISRPGHVTGSHRGKAPTERPGHQRTCCPHTHGTAGTWGPRLTVRLVLTER